MDDEWRSWTACVFVERELSALPPLPRASDAVASLSSATVPAPLPTAAAPVTAPAAATAPPSALPQATGAASLDPQLVSALREWRTVCATAEQRAPYLCATNALIDALATHRPRSLAALRAVPGMGPTRMEKYGDALLALIKQHAEAADSAAARNT